ncbi:hypothetical protein TNCV_3236301 [Trichonephila clavipes]|nr:hypothetical protein TNCV_3236301 [Trichonephila clavipes]
MAEAAKSGAIWKNRERTAFLMDAALAFKAPRRKKHRILLRFQRRLPKATLASCKRLISWFLLYKRTELGRKIVPVRPPKF